MANEMHSAAPHHLPFFVTAPGETDVLFNAMAVFVIVMVLLVIVFYFKLHALPEQIAHKGQKIQFELVALLALISLFTHNHYFWIAGLLLAFIPIPDFSTPLNGMAESLARMAGRRNTSDQVPGRDLPVTQVNTASAPETMVASSSRPANTGQELNSRVLPMDVRAGASPASETPLLSTDGDSALRRSPASKEKA